MHGSSGAEVRFIGGGRVRKIGNTRVLEQGRWLHHHPAPGLPRIDSYTVDPPSYVMERLHRSQRGQLVETPVVPNIIATLQTSVWSKQGEIGYDETMHIDKIRSIYPSQWRREFFDLHYEFLIAMQKGLLMKCLTHGDPTVDNVMYRGDQLVLIDPIPATPAVPDLRCVDLGKVLQSCLGFEVARYGSFRRFNRSAHPIFLAARDQVEWDAVKYWAAVHILRALPYMPEDVRPDVEALFVAALRV